MRSTRRRRRLRRRGWEALAQDEVRPLRGLRRSIAKSMVQSHTYVVPFTFVEECDTTALTSLRERVNAELARRGGEAQLLPSWPRRCCTGSRNTRS